MPHTLPFARPEPVLHAADEFAPKARRRGVLARTSCSIDSSRLRSATSLSGFVFSSSSCRSRRSSDGPRPPYFCFQRKNVASETPILRHTSATEVPSSACSEAKATWSTYMSTGAAGLLHRQASPFGQQTGPKTLTIGGPVSRPGVKVGNR